MPGHEALEDEVGERVAMSMAGSCTRLRDQVHEIIPKNVSATKKWLRVLLEQDIREQLLAFLAVKLHLSDQEGPAHLLTTCRTTHSN